MDDGQRRPAPSPIIVAQDNSAQQPLHASSAAHNVHAAPQTGQMNMPFIKRHVTRRLKLAKEECNKDLMKVTEYITAFFEERLRDADNQDTDPPPRAPAAVRPGELRRAVRHLEGKGDDTDESADEDADHSPASGVHHRTRTRASTASSSIAPASGRSTSPEVFIPSVSSSPGVRRHPSTSSRHSLAPNSSHGEISPRKSITGNAASSGSAPATWGTGAAARRLSRAIRVPVVATSETSSRSTSRSRSPLPAAAGRADSSPRTSSNAARRSSRIWLDEPLDPFMMALHAITAAATEIIDMSLPALTAEPGACNELVNRIQAIGRGWDEHPSWIGRGWYVQALLAVAKLARVVEWWQAEKQFWNFEEEEDESSEPLAFVLKPEDPTDGGPAFGSAAPDDDLRRRASRPLILSRPSRDGSFRPQTRSSLDIGHARSVKFQETEQTRLLATERLRKLADEAQRQNIIVELSLDGDELIWINHAWAEVIGSDPDECMHKSIASFMSPADWSVFRDATEKLQEDDSHTLQIRFRMLVNVQQTLASGGPAMAREMEGKGMLMLDRGDGTPSHTMWVIKPVGPPEQELGMETIIETGLIGDEPGSAGTLGAFHRRNTEEPVTPFPFTRPISTAVILCRICEVEVPDWFFEKHNETCNEVHKLEAEIGECNDSITELRTKIRELTTAIENPQSTVIPEYRGMAIYCGAPGSSSPLQVFRPALPARFQKVSLRKLHAKVLETLDEMLQVTLEISIPALKEDQAGEPMERQRLLSPSSERKFMQVRTWPKPASDDPALARLVLDADLLIRTKLENVTRMQNTIRYSEKVRQEWEDKVEQTLASLEEESSDGEGDSDNEGNEASGDRAAADEIAPSGQEMSGSCSSTTSEYEFGRDPPSSSDPTPVAAASPAPGFKQLAISPTPVPIPSVPATYTGLGTRSSTPSSVSSPLARAIPIVASGDLAAAATAVMTDSVSPTAVAESLSQSVRRQVSGASLIEPRLVVTPPLSPTMLPRDITQYSRKPIVTLAASAMVSPQGSMAGPLSPRIPSIAPASRTTPSSIKDFEIIKPISKGAFGSVFLAKKKVTGDYFAIKVLKKADMIAKNQITNVKAERMILMRQSESPFVVKLFWTFQSKDNLYLVMEYLNGGDCAALIKSLGALPEEWTKNYIAEVILGLEYLHDRGVVHRDLKPDNLLIDESGHLKLTDFGLSRIGLLGRQTRDTALAMRGRAPASSRPPSMDSAYISSPVLMSGLETPANSYFSHRGHSAPRAIGPTPDDAESSGSESLSGLLSRPYSKAMESPLQSFAMDLSQDLRPQSVSSGTTPPGEQQKFVGTPDYLAPETILGSSGDDRTVDWWALGVITYEFLYGIPPFHDESPEKVFDNIISRRINWHEDLVEYSEEARDFMERLMVTDPTQRLGAKGAQEVKDHPFFAGVEWDKVMHSKAQFIPQVTDPESTDYFDPRGATSLLFHDDETTVPSAGPKSAAESPSSEDLMHSTTLPLPVFSTSGPQSAADDFGAFSFKNLPVLKQANDDVIRRLRSDSMAQSLAEPAVLHTRRKSLSQRIKKPTNVITDTRNAVATPPSPSTSVSSVASSPRASLPSLTPAGGNHSRRPSELGAVERFKQSQMDADRRNSMPSRLRTASVSSSDPGVASDQWSGMGHSAPLVEGTPPSSVTSSEIRKPDSGDRVVTCLLAEDNPISMKIMETLLTRMGCRCVLVTDGAEAISVALGDIKFDCIMMDYQMPLVDGEAAAKYIKSTKNRNSTTPIIAVSAYSGSGGPSSHLFAASLAKPLNKSDLLTVMRQLGFKVSTQEGPKPHTKLISR